MTNHGKEVRKIQVYKTMQNPMEILQSSNKSTQTEEGFGDLLQLMLGLTKGSEQSQAPFSQTPSTEKTNPENENLLESLYMLTLNLPVGDAVSGDLSSEQTATVQESTPQVALDDIVATNLISQGLETKLPQPQVLDNTETSQEMPGTVGQMQPTFEPKQNTDQQEYPLVQEQPLKMLPEQKAVEQPPTNATEQPMEELDPGIVEETPLKESVQGYSENRYSQKGTPIDGTVTANPNSLLSINTKPITQETEPLAVPVEGELQENQFVTQPTEPTTAGKKEMPPQDLVYIQPRQGMQPQPQQVARVASELPQVIQHVDGVLSQKQEVATSQANNEELIDSTQSVDEFLATPRPVLLVNEQSQKNADQSGQYQTPGHQEGVVAKGSSKPLAQTPEFTLQETSPQATRLPEQNPLVAPKELPVGQVPSRLMEMVRSMMLQQSPGEATLKMKLQPERLGEMTVKLTWSNGELSAQFMTTSGIAKEALESSFPQLRELLAQQNIRLSEAAVFMGQQSGQGGGGAPNQQWQYRGQSRRSGSYAELNLQESVTPAEVRTAVDTGVDITV